MLLTDVFDAKDTNTVLAGQHWYTFNSYDDQGRLLWTAEPSTQISPDATSPDLLNRQPDGTYQYMSRDQGLISGTDYYGSADVTPGYVKDTYIRHGQSGEKVLQNYYRYDYASGADIHPVSDLTVYRDETADLDDASAINTHYDYTFDGNHIESRTTHLPPLDTLQNGSGNDAVIVQNYDALGRLHELIDAAGYKTTYGYDDFSNGVISVIQQIGNGQPDLVTSAIVDDFGRTTDFTDAAGQVTHTDYLDGANSSKITVTPPAGPKSVVYSNAALGYVDAYTTDDKGAFLSLTRTDLDYAGRTVSVERYRSLGFTYAEDVKDPLGTQDFAGRPGDYYVSTYCYDSRGLLRTTYNAVGTIYETMYDALGRVYQTKVGTSGANMTLVQENQYDRNGVGDGNLTQTTLYPGGKDNPSPGSDPNRVTAVYYDWRGRAVATLAGYGAGGDLNRPLTVQTYNNLDWVTETRVYDGDSITIDSTASDGVPAVPGEDEVFLRARTTQEYDDRGRAFRSNVFNIDQQVGTGSDALITNVWYDDRDLVIRTVSPGGLFTKTKYDGAGRPTDVYLTDGGSDSQCGNPNDITDDTVIEHTHADFDALGNVLMTTLEQRQPDGNMRTSYTQSWYDSGGRSLGTADLGTAGGNYNTPAAARAAGALVTSYTYDAAGNVQTVTDPLGTITWTEYDALGRRERIVENSQPSGPACGGANWSAWGTNVRKTWYEYNALDQVTWIHVTNYEPGITGAGDTNIAHTEFQNTHYVYGTSLDGTFHAIDNSYLVAVVYPDQRKETFTPNRLGEATTQTDRNGVTHAYLRDFAGRVASDQITSFGTNAANIDQTIQRLSYGYDVLGHVIRATSDIKLNGAWSVNNEVQRDYNGFGQLLTEWQAHSGAVVTGTSASIVYGYSLMNGASRLTSVTYPNATAITCVYDAGLDRLIGRVSALTMGATELERYTYLGIGTVLGKTRTAAGQADMELTLDAFGRAQTITWSGASLVDGYTYAYDADGNMTSRSNATNPALNQSFAFDTLNHLKSFTEGATTVSWDNDSQGNRNGAAYDNLAYSSNWFAGINTDSVPLGTGEQAGVTYDGWGRLTKLTGLRPGDLVAARIRYVYDALGREIAETVVGLNTGAVTARQDLYYDGTAVVEETTGTATVAVSRQFVWSPADGRLILRDRDADGSAANGLEERTWALEDAQGNVTAVLAANGSPLLRWSYKQDGSPVAFTAGWTWLGPTNATVTGLSWEHLYGQEIWHTFTTSSGNGPDSIAGAGQSGLYERGDGQWSEPRYGKLLKPNPVTLASGGNAYDPGVSAGWGYLATGIRMGAWLGGPIVGLAVNWVGSMYGRGLDHENAAQIIIGGAFDATAITAVAGGLTNHDLVTWNNLRWGAGERLLYGGLGLLGLRYLPGSFRYPMGMIPRMPVGPTVGEAATWAMRQGGEMLSALEEAFDPMGALMPRMVDGRGAGTGAAGFLPGEYLPGMGAYKNVGGHHPLSGRAFGYETYDEAMAIGKDFMQSNGWRNHPQPLTQYQREAYMAFGQTGEPLTMTRMAQIEVDAMVKAGVPRQYAEQAISAAIWERFANGQFTPTHIPWVGTNPGVKL